MVNDPDVEEEEVGVLIALKDAALKPIKIAASPRARRAYLSTVLFTLTALFLLAVAATAYILFYFSYVPVRGFKQPVYFHFETGANPHAIVQLKKGHIVSDQPYDVSVSLHLPRTPANTAAGNFMVDLQLLAPQLGQSEDEAVVLAQESRPAILTYYSPIMEHIHKAIGLPLYLFGWRKEEEKIDMPIMEGVEFSRGWRNVPATARIELSNAANMQLYSAIISFKTRLRGLR
jgi:seipin